jgi:hypothetical protein
MSIKYLGFNVPVLLKDGTTRLSQHLKTSDILSPVTSINNIEIINDKLYKIIPRYGSDFIIGHQNKINNKELKKTIIDFPLKPIKIDPYFIGLCIANNNYNNEQIVFNVKDTNEEIYNYVISMIEYINIKYIIENGFLKINDPRIIDYFHFYSLFNNRIIPDIYKYNKLNFRYRILSGILDAKGHYFHFDGNRGGYYEIIDDDERLITDIDYIAKSVGLYTILYKKNSQFLLHICGNNLCYMQSFLLKPDMLPNPVCDYKIAPILFDTKCVKLNISGENITLADFTMI